MDPPVPGNVFGHYRLLEKISEGRLSTLFRGEHAKTNEVVAVKVLSDYGCKVADKLTRKLKKDWEGSRALKLEHRNVVRTLSCGKQRGRYYIAMEYLPGGTLGQLLQTNSRLLQGNRIEIMRQAGRGLAYVHGQGVVHRDVCPRNVMLSTYRVAKLIDFGVAADRTDRLRNTGTRTGRPAYMAPELIRTNRFAERTDIYAFGVSLYEVATGQRTLRGNEDTFQALAAALNVEIPTPRSIRPSLSPRLEKIILRAMAPQAQSRYPSMQVLLEALEGVSDDDL